MKQKNLSNEQLKKVIAEAMTDGGDSPVSSAAGDAVTDALERDAEAIDTAFIDAYLAEEGRARGALSRFERNAGKEMGRVRLQKRLRGQEQKPGAGKRIVKTAVLVAASIVVLFLTQSVANKGGKLYNFEPEKTDVSSLQVTIVPYHPTPKLYFERRRVDTPDWMTGAELYEYVLVTPPPSE